MVIFLPLLILCSQERWRPARGASMWRSWTMALMLVTLDSAMLCRCPFQWFRLILTGDWWPWTRSIHPILFLGIVAIEAQAYVQKINSEDFRKIWTMNMVSPSALNLSHKRDPLPQNCLCSSLKLRRKLYYLWPRGHLACTLTSLTANQEVLSASLSVSEPHALHAPQFEWIHFRRTGWHMTTTTKRQKGWRWSRVSRQRSSPAKLFTSGEIGWDWVGLSSKS